MMTPKRLSFVVLTALLLSFGLKTPTDAQEPKPKVGPVSANPRGEPLLYEPASTEIRVSGQAWWAVAVSPDGKSAATAHGNGNTKGAVRIWDLASGKVKWSAEEPSGTRTVAISPDGKTVATGSFDRAIRFYDADSGTLWAKSDPAAGHTGGVNSVRFFAKGKYLVSAGLDRTVRVWDADAVRAARKSQKPSDKTQIGRSAWTSRWFVSCHLAFEIYSKRAPGEPVGFPPVAVFEGHTQSVYSADGSADGKLLVSGGQDRTARLWEMPNPVPKMGEPPAAVKKEAFLFTGHNDGVEAVAFSPDGTLVATGGWDNQLHVRGVADRKTVFSGTLPRRVLAAAFSADGKQLAVGTGTQAVQGQPGDVRVWDVAAKKEVAARDCPDGVVGVAFTPDGKTVASVGRDLALHLWPHAGKDARTIRLEGAINYTAQPILASAVSPNGDFLAFAGEAKSVYVLNRRTGMLAAELTGHEDVATGLAFSPNGDTLATASYDKTVRLWDAATWKTRHELKGHTGWVMGVAFSPDGKTLATGSYDKSVRLWSAATGEPKATWKEHTAGVRAVAFSPDGARLVSGGSDRLVRVWDVAEGKVLLSLKGHKGVVRAVAFAPDGQTIATGSEDRSARLWDAKTGAERRAFEGLLDMVTAVRFSAKGQTLAVGTFAGTISVLDPLTGRTRSMLRAHGDSVTGLAFADEGENLLSVSLDHAIRQWPAAKASAVAPVQALPGKTGVVTAMAVTPDGATAILGYADGTVTRWDVAGNRATALPQAHSVKGGAVQLAASAGGLVAAVSKDDKFQVFAHASGRDANWSGSGRFAQFTPDGKHLAVATGKDVVLHDAATGKEVRKFEAGHTENVIRVCFSSDGKLMASAGDDTKVRLWDVATGTKRQDTPPFGNYSTITFMAFSPDGTRLAVAAYGPEQPPPDDMTGNFQVTRQVRVFAVPAADAAGFVPNPAVFVPQPMDQPIVGLDWTLNGQALVTPASDGTVRLTEFGPNGPQETQRYRAHDSAVLASASAFEGGVFLTAGEDLAVRRWRVPGAAAPPGLARVTSPGLTRVWEALPSPDGKYLVAAGEGDKTFRVYGAVPSPGLPVDADRFGSVYGLAFSPDNAFLVTGHDKGEVVVRDAATGRPIRTLSGLSKRVSSVAFAEGGAAVVAVGGNWMNGTEAGEAVVWDFAAGTVRHTLDAPSLQWMVAVHPNGKTAAGAGTDAKVRVWDLATGKVAKTFEKGWGLYTVAFSADGSRLAAASADRHVRIWDTASGELLREILVAPNLRVTQALFSPDGKEVVVSAWKGSGQGERAPVLTAYAIDKPDAAPRQFPAHPASVTNLAFLPDGKTLIASGGEQNGVGSLRVYDFATAKPLGQFTGHKNWAQNFTVSPDGKLAASTGWATPTSGELRLWAPRGFRPLAEVKVPDEGQYISGAAISADGKLLVLGGWGQTLTAWDMTDPAKPKLKKALKDHAAGLRSVAFDAAGKRFVSSDESGVVKVWDAASLELIVSIQASKSAVYRAKFTPDGRELVTASGDWKAKAKGEVRVWNPATGKEAGRFPDQTREVWDVGFLDGGKLMVTVGTLSGSADDAHIKVWDYATRRAVRAPVPNGSFSGARCLAISGDGRLLAVASSTGPLKVFDTAAWQEVLSVPDLTGCDFRVSFAPGGNSVIVANGDGAVITVRLPARSPGG